MCANLIWPSRKSEQFLSFLERRCYLSNLLIFLSIYFLSKGVHRIKKREICPNLRSFLLALQSDLTYCRSCARNWGKHGKVGKPSNPEFFALIFVVWLEKCVCSKKQNCSILPTYIKLDRDIQLIALVACRNKL